MILFVLPKFGTSRVTRWYSSSSQLQLDFKWEYIFYPKIIHKYYQMHESIYVMRFYYALTAYLAWSLCCTEMRSESIVFSNETLNV